MQLNTFTKMSAAALALALSSSSVKAEGFDTTQTQVRVRYADLNTSTPDGAKALMQRLSRASKLVCDAFAQPLDLAAYAEQRRCAKEALRTAVREVNQPMLTALANGAAPQMQIATAGR